MIFCRTLQKEFATKEAMFKELKDNEERIISLKRSNVYKSIDKGQISPFSESGSLVGASKAAIDMQEGYFYPIINTTKYMDSHDDVHFDGIWNKSLKEQKGEIFYVMDHDLAVGSLIAWKEDVTAMVKMIPWRDLGKDFEGETQALIYKIPRDKVVNANAAQVIDEKRKVQNSVRMQYVKIKFAVDSNEAYYKENKKYYDDNIDKIANREEVEEQGYFYGVEEAKILKEGSMVLFGSNDVTPILTPEPQKSTQTEPSKDTQRTNNLLNLI